MVGYAYGGQYKVRAAYAWACEVSVYLEMGLRRTGLGRALYEELFARLVDRGFLTAVAGMTLPNPASEGLHRALGFEPAGIYRKIGFKHGAWHDVAWTQRELAPRRRRARAAALSRPRPGLRCPRCCAWPSANPRPCCWPPSCWASWCTRSWRAAVGRALFSVFGIAVLGLVLLAVRSSPAWTASA